MGFNSGFKGLIIQLQERVSSRLCLICKINCIQCHKCAGQFVFVPLTTAVNVTFYQEGTNTMDACITQLCVNNNSVSVVPTSGLEQTSKPLKKCKIISYFRKKTLFKVLYFVKCRMTTRRPGELSTQRMVLSFQLTANGHVVFVKLPAR